MQSLVTDGMSNEFAELLIEQENDNKREIDRLIERQDTFEVLSVLALEWAEVGWADVGERWANVRLTSYSFELNLAVGEHDNATVLVGFMRELRKALGGDWQRSSKPDMVNGKMSYSYRSVRMGISFDFDVYISNAGKCEVKEEERFSPVDVETRIINGKAVTGKVDTVMVTDCGGFFITPEQLKEAETKELTV